MTTSTNHDPRRARAAVPVQRRITLEVLRRFGPQPVEALPRAWPLTREDVQAVLRDLRASGDVSVVQDMRVPGRTLARITEEGTRRLRHMDDAAIAAEVAVAEAAATPWALLA